MEQINLSCLLTGERTYWLLDLLDFAVTKGISEIHSTIESILDLNSHHSPKIKTQSTSIIWKKTHLNVVPKRWIGTLPQLCQWQYNIKHPLRKNWRHWQIHAVSDHTNSKSSWKFISKIHGISQENHNISLDCGCYSG